MIEIKTDDFSETDFRGLAKLHIESIPDTSLSIIGEKAAALMYRFIYESDKETLLATTVDGIICGGIVASYDPKTITKRFIMSYSVRFFIRFFTSLFRNTSRLIELFSLLDTDEAYKYTPELMFIYTAPEMRSKGIGGMLVKNVITQMEGIARFLYVRTLDNKENRAIPFYEKNGFKRHEIVEYFGKLQVIMVREF